MNDRWIGLGLSTLWGLPENHRLNIAGATHDACHDALEVFLGYCSLEDVPKKPSYYKELVTNKLQELSVYYSEKSYARWSHRQIILSWIAEKDIEFLVMCTNLQRKLKERLLGKLFYRLVKFYSLIKFGFNDVKPFKNSNS